MEDNLSIANYVKYRVILKRKRPLAISTTLLSSNTKV